MENASKALIMAGSVLISLLVITLVVVGYQQLSDWQQTVEDSEQTATDTEFIRQVEQFNRNLYGSELLSLINYVEDYNAQYTEDGYIPIQLNVTITNDLFTGEDYDYFRAGTYDLEELYDEVKGSDGIESEIEKLEKPKPEYNNKSPKYYWTKTYREIAAEFDINIPSNTPTYDLETTLLDNAGTKRGNIEKLIEDVRNYDLLDSIYTQFKEGKRFRPGDASGKNGFVYDNRNGRSIEINFTEI